MIYLINIAKGGFYPFENVNFETTTSSNLIKSVQSKEVKIEPSANTQAWFTNLSYPFISNKNIP